MDSLYKELEIYSPQLASLKASVLLSGSMYFGDPSMDPDIDIDFVCRDISQNHEYMLEKIIDNMEMSMDIRVEAGTKYISQIMENLRNFGTCDFLDGGIYASSARKAFYFGAPTLLMGKDIYLSGNEHNKKHLRNMRKRIDLKADDDAVFRAIMIINLDEMTDRKRKAKPVYANKK